MDAWNSSKTSNRAGGYRWFKIWLGLGGALAVLLLVNSIQNYSFVARRIVLEQVRREMNRQVVTLERQLREAGGKAALADLAEAIVKEPIEAVEVRDREGNVLVSAGDPAAGTVFGADEIRSRLRNREPLFQVRRTGNGPAVVEMFPIRLPGPPPAGFATLQITASLEKATAAFWPVRRNLIINCSAAVALLVAIVLIAVRFRPYIQGKQLEQQVAIARKVQQALLPANGSGSDRVRVAAECVPAEGVGGDFYDTFQAAHGRTALVIGDVSGKGIPAALLMGVIHGAVRSSSWAESPRAHEEASRRLNALLCERATGERYATMFWAYFDENRSELHYVNAGHCPPLLARRRGGRIEVSALDEGGPVLGLLAGSRYEQASAAVESGDMVVMFSDGVAEAVNGAGEEFGEDRIRQIIEHSQAVTAPELHAEIVEAVNEFTGGGAPQDDLTLLVAQFAPEPALRTESFEIEEMAAV